MTVAPGWYKDPAEPTTQRWWDGGGWVGDPLPADATPPPGPPPARSRAEPRVPAVPGLPGSTETLDPSGLRIPPRHRDVQPPVDRIPPDHREPARPAVPRGQTLATPGARLLARLVDIGMVLGLNVVVNGWFVYQYWTEISPFLAAAWRQASSGQPVADLPAVGDQAGNLQLVILLLATALWFAYEVPAVANTGQTPGKRLLRIKVVRLESDQRLGFGRSLRRWNVMGVPTLLWWCFGVGFLLQMVDALYAVIDRPLQQALHDKSAHTVVVALRPHRVPRDPAEGSAARTPHEGGTR